MGHVPQAPCQRGPPLWTPRALYSLQRAPEGSSREFFSALLEVPRQQGYIVLEAASGEEALRLADESGHGTIHLLLTDVDLPSLDGPETARRIKASRPNIKVLYISGNSRAVTELGVRSDLFLRKPFTLAELVQGW